MALLDSFNDLAGKTTDNVIENNEEHNEAAAEDAARKNPSLGYIKKYDNHNEDGSQKRRRYSGAFYAKFSTADKAEEEKKGDK